MKKLTIALLTGLISTSGWSACTYNFDANQTQITQAFNGASKFPNVNSSNVDFNFTSSTNDIVYAAFSSTFANALSQSKKSFWQTTGDKLIPTTGILAFEFKIKVPTYTLPQGETLILFPIGVSGTTSGNQNAFMIMIMQGNNNDDSTAFHIAAGAYGNASPVIEPLVTTPSGFQKFGFYINQDTKQIGLTVNGINKGYIGTYSTPATNFAADFTAIVKPLTTNASVLGQNVSLELITDRNNLTEPFPLGAKDICGNVI